MRIIATIPHPVVKISVFQMNSKYLIKMELGSFEQTYKISEEEIQSIEELEQICTGEFMKNVITRFESMRNDFFGALER